MVMAQENVWYRSNLPQKIRQIALDATSFHVVSLGLPLLVLHLLFMRSLERLHLWV